jgi:hypothetical protein
MGSVMLRRHHFAALAIGLVAVLVDRANVPRMAMIVAPTVIMMPGLRRSLR